MMEAAVMNLHSHEYARASVMSSDLELAFEMQLNEAILASVRDMPGGSSGRTAATQADAPSRRKGSPSVGDDAALAYLIQSSEISRREQLLVDQEAAREALMEMSDELHQRAHDREFAKAVADIGEQEWTKDGDLFERPFVKASTSTDDSDVDIADLSNNQVYKLYYAMVREDSGYVGIAWALTDKAGFAFFQQSNCLGLGISSTAANYMALIGGLDFAVSAGLRNIEAYGNSAAIPNQVSGLWKRNSKSIIKFIDQVQQIGKSLNTFHVYAAPATKIAYVTNLARKAVASHFEILVNERKACETTEECPICCEKVPTVDVFVPRGCSHRICRACLLQYVEVQVKANQVPVGCPQECAERLDLDQCRPFLTSKVVESYEKRLTEASIPESQRVYCPFAKCSALMSKEGITDSNVGSSSRHASPNASPVGCTECMECHRLFCVECHVPWHTGMSCVDYQKLPPEERDKEDASLYQLARNKKWQRCKKCQSVIELDKGCYHMTCRCGYEFCYTCGAEWKNKEATCKCKLWDENNIISDDEVDDDYDEYDEDEEDFLGNDYESDTDTDYGYDSHQRFGGAQRVLMQPFKTRICKFWRGGFCREGEFCTFAHGTHELRYPPL